MAAASRTPPSPSDPACGRTAERDGAVFTPGGDADFDGGGQEDEEVIDEDPAPGEDVEDGPEPAEPDDWDLDDFEREEDEEDEEEEDGWEGLSS